MPPNSPMRESKRRTGRKNACVRGDKVTAKKQNKKKPVIHRESACDESVSDVFRCESCVRVQIRGLLRLRHTHMAELYKRNRNGKQFFAPSSTNTTTTTTTTHLCDCYRELREAYISLDPPHKCQELSHLEETQEPEE